MILFSLAITPKIPSLPPTETRYVDGGAVNYAAHAAVRLGLKTAVVTRLAREDKRMIDKLEQAGVDCFPEYTPASTLMKLEYKTSNVDQRTLSVTGLAGTVPPATDGWAGNKSGGGGQQFARRSGIGLFQGDARARRAS